MSTPEHDSPRVSRGILSFAHHSRDCAPRKRSEHHLSDGALGPFAQMMRYKRTCFPAFALRKWSMRRPHKLTLPAMDGLHAELQYWDMTERRKKTSCRVAADRGAQAPSVRSRKERWQAVTHCAAEAHFAGICGAEAAPLRRYV